MADLIWSSSDSPYTCLKDVERTLAFKEAISSTIRPGDIVVEAGAGTGILSLFAAAAGAGHVYAVEIDGLLAAALERTVRINRLDDRITVVPGDAATADLPGDVNVFIGELLETALIDEEQVRVVTALQNRGVIGATTTLLPERYATAIELVHVSTEFYGFQIAAPFHEWPNYRTDATRWHPTPVQALTECVPLVQVDFRRRIDPTVDQTAAMTGRIDGVANAVRISGRACFSTGRELGQTNAVNGDKIMQLERPIRVVAGEAAVVRVRYQMGGGLRTLEVTEVAALLPAEGLVR